MNTYINFRTGEYPVLKKHIINRGKGFKDYALVYNSQKPAVAASQKLREVTPILIGDKYFKQYVVVDKSTKQIEEVYNNKLQEIKKAFIEASIKPRVGVQLISVDKIIYVDGGRSNKDDFKETWENMADDETTIVKDADNNFQNDLTKDDLHAIYQAILVNGKALYARKWELENLVNSAETAEDVEAIQVSF